jgi:hypothetical protein
MGTPELITRIQRELWQFGYALEWITSLDEGFPFHIATLRQGDTVVRTVSGRSPEEVIDQLPELAPVLFQLNRP